MIKISIYDIKPNKIQGSLRSQNMVIFGSPGTGKSTFAAELFKERAFFIDFEYSLKMVEGIICKQPSDYFDLLEIIAELEEPEGREHFDTIVIDTSSSFVRLLEAYEMGRQKKHCITIQDCGSYGKGAANVKAYYTSIMDRLKRCGYQVISIFHVEEEKQYKELKDGTKELDYVIYRPDIPKKLDKVVLSSSDCNLFFFYNEKTNKLEICTKKTMKCPDVKNRMNLPAILPVDAKVFQEECNKYFEDKKDIISKEVKKSELDGKKIENYKDILKEIKEIVQELVKSEKSTLKDLTKIVNNILGMDSDGVQIKLEDMTQDNVVTLKIVKMELQKLNK